MIISIGGSIMRNRERQHEKQYNEHSMQFFILDIGEEVRKLYGEEVGPSNPC